jgi:tetratricopeptide (TPR) repeat protein
MAGIDPSDLRIQVRLADLYRAANQKEQAVMQYGLIGSMLLKRGAHDEAAQVFQKALELSPDDVETQRNLVRSLLAQKNGTAAMAVLRAAPRTGESLGLMAEAQLEMGERAEAVRTAEQALALDADAETPRLFLSRLRIQESSFDKALDAVAPLVLTAVTRREFARATEFLEPILAADPAHTGTLQKLAHVLEAEGNRAAFAKVHVQLGKALEARNPADAREHYLRAQEADPSNVEAAQRLQDIGAPPAPPPPEAPAPAPETPPEYHEFVLDLEDSASIHAPQPNVPSLDVDEEPVSAGPAAVLPEMPPPPAVPHPPASAPAKEAVDDGQVETLIVEAEVFARYGLADKAIERLFALVRRRPDLLKARERLVELLAETRNPALPREAEALAEALEAAGQADDARRVLQRAGLAAGEARPQPPAASLPQAVEVEFEEFDLGHPISPPAEMPSPAPFAVDAIDFGAPDTEPPPTIERLATPEPVAPAETEFVSYEQLGNLLEDEMTRAGDAPPAAPAPAPVVDEQNLFADEQKFFNLAEELEKELGEEAAVEEAAEISAPQGEVSLEDIFREFKKGVEQQLSAEDYETHYNLGIAYKEMGLVDEAVGEFQLASKDPTRAVECCSMLGHCFLEKGMPQLAINWFRKGLETPAINEHAMAGMLYDLARVYQDTGDTDSAYRTYQEVYGLNANYRDVVQRVKELDEVRRNS